MSSVQASKLCFVASPIGDPDTPERNHADWLLQEIITPVFTAYPDYRVERSDKITTPGMIDSQVINRLHTAELVIIDMTFQKANVFYEMGIRHKIPLPTIHMYRADQKIPFDVKPYRAIPFKYDHPNDLPKARSDLKAAVDEVIRGIEIDNPVTRARGLEKIEERATDFEKLMVQEISALRQQQTILENTVKHLIWRDEQRAMATPLRAPHLETTMASPFFPSPVLLTTPPITAVSESVSNPEKPR
jgi:hypothetical protein